MTVRIDNSGVDKFGEAFPVIFAILVILMLVVIAANFILRTKDDSKEAIRRKVKILEKQSKCNFPKTNTMLWKWNSAALDGNRPFYMMKNKLKYAILTLCMEIQ